MAGLRLSAAGLVAAALLAGCGGDDEPPAVSWANDLCSSITDWRTAVDETTAGLQGGTPQLGDLQEAGEQLEEATRGLADDLRELGPPETEAGAQADEELDALADAVEDDLDEVRSALEGVDSLSEVLEAASSVTTALSSLQQDLSATIAELQQLDPAGELREGFEEADSCDEVRDGG